MLPAGHGARQGSDGCSRIIRSAPWGKATATDLHNGFPME